MGDRQTEVGRRGIKKERERKEGEKVKKKKKKRERERRSLSGRTRKEAVWVLYGQGTVIYLQLVFFWEINANKQYL